MKSTPALWQLWGLKPGEVPQVIDVFDNELDCESARKKAALNPAYRRVWSVPVDPTIHITIQKQATAGGGPGCCG